MQTAVYHKLTLKGNKKSLFIIEAHSTLGERILEWPMEDGFENPEALAPLTIHRLLISRYLKKPVGIHLIFG
jgi:hypothetical protein